METPQSCAFVQNPEIFSDLDDHVNQVHVNQVVKNRHAIAPKYGRSQKLCIQSFFGPLKSTAFDLSFTVRVIVECQREYCLHYHSFVTEATSCATAMVMLFAKCSCRTPMAC